MGAEQHKFTNQKQNNEIRSQKKIPQQYKICYQNWLADPSYLTNLLNENKELTASILSYFPNSRSSYDQFIEMVMYLRRYDPVITHNQYAKFNVHNTTILDRFFMLILHINRYDQLESTIINREQMEKLFLQLMKLFMPNPRLGFGYKLLKFIGMKEVQQSSVKQYSANLRQFLPHIQKHLKDYYTNKFMDMKKNGYLLQYFKSDILFEDAVFLSMKLAQLTDPKLTLLYEPRNFGMSFTSIHKNIIGYTGPWLLIIQHIQKDTQGKNKVFHLGTYQSGPILDVSGFQGDFKGFLFEIEPRIRVMTTDKGTGGNFYFTINNVDERISKMRKGIGFGGTKDKQNFKLWIDQDIDKSTVYNGHDSTYGFGSIVNPNTSKLSITKMQIWGLGSKEDLQNRDEYWQSRDSQIQKRRKVNKSQFLQGDAGLMFENTFGHRDQVYGVIQRKTEQQPKKSSSSIQEKTQSKVQHQQVPNSQSNIDRNN